MSSMFDWVGTDYPGHAAFSTLTENQMVYTVSGRSSRTTKTQSLAFAIKDTIDQYDYDDAETPLEVLNVSSSWHAGTGYDVKARFDIAIPAIVCQWMGDNESVTCEMVIEWRDPRVSSPILTFDFRDMFVLGRLLYSRWSGGGTSNWKWQVLFAGVVKTGNLLTKRIHLDFHWKDKDYGGSHPITLAFNAEWNSNFTSESIRPKNDPVVMVRRASF